MLKLKDIAGNVSSVKYSDLLAGTQSSGVVPEIDRMLWRDKHGRGTVAVATDAAEFTPVVAKSGIRTIAFYRKETVAVSFLGEDQFRPCFRAYRAYLAACISVVDAWLNERAWYRVNDTARNSDLTPQEITTLNNRLMSLAKKLQTWPTILFRHPALDESSIEWQTFNEIRRARNAIIHVNQPEFNFSLRRVARSLNDCKVGIGAFLALLHSMEKTHPSPGVLALQFAPEVSFVPKAG
jgi:hypothetical protein